MAARQIARPRRLWWLWTVLVLWAAPPAAAADATHPQVLVRLEVLAPKFKRNLPERAQAEQALAGLLAAYLEQRYRFAKWKVAPESASSVLGVLLLRVEEQPAAPNPRIVIKWYGSFGAGASNVELALPQIEVYPPTDPNWDTNSREGFESRVSSALSSRLTDEFDRLVLSKFVRELPIASSVTPVPGDKTIVVPLVWEEVRLGEDSRVVVRITKSTGAAAQRGTLLLGVITQRPKEPGLGLVQGCVHEATFAGRNLKPVGCWHPDIPDLLKGAEVRCFISEYKPVEFAGTSGGLVVDPR